MVYLVLAHPIIQSIRATVVFATDDPKKASEEREKYTRNREDIFFYTIQEIELK